MSDRIAGRLGTSRRRFFQTAAGMAACFVAINQMFGPIFDASEAGAATPERADARVPGNGLFSCQTGGFHACIRQVILERS